MYVGVDPFVYFEYLFRRPTMPPLSYHWVLRGIRRETTPWIESTLPNGRPCTARDESRRAFVPARETKAWTDDDGQAEYVLACERIGGPARRGSERRQG